MENVGFRWIQEYAFESCNNYFHKYPIFSSKIITIKYSRLKINLRRPFIFSRAKTRRLCATFISWRIAFIIFCLYWRPHRRSAVRIVARSRHANAIGERMFLLRSIFHLWPGVDRLESRAFLFLSFFFFFPRFPRSRSHRHSILGEHRERSYSRWRCIGCGVFETGVFERGGT